VQKLGVFKCSNPRSAFFSYLFHKKWGGDRLFTFRKSEYSSGQREKCGEEHG